MKKRFYTKLLFLFALLLTVSTSAWADAVTLTAGTNGSACTVNEKAGIKVGTSSKGGSMSITVPANTTKLSLHAAAWKGVTGLSLNITGGTASPASISLNPDNGISNNSPFTLAGNESDFLFEITLSGVTTETTLTFTSSIAKRFVVWDASAVVSSGGGDTPTLEESDLALTPSALSFDLFNNSDAQVINYTTSSTGAVTVSASEYVETAVDETNKTITVTPKKKTPSEQTITVSQAADETYKGGTVEFTVSVADSAPYVQPTSVSITPNYSFWGKNAQFSGNNYDNLSGEKDNVSLSWVRGDGSTYANQNAMRFYRDNTLTFTAPMGYQIKQIEFEATFKGDETFSVGTLSENTWSGKATEVTMSRPSDASSYATITKITITLQEIIPLVLSSIDLSGDYPTTFHQDDAFSHEGLVVTANYDDETSADVTADATFSEPDMTTLGKKTVTVSYTEGEVTKTATYDINVNAPAVLTGITLSGEYPIAFYVDDEFSHVGIEVTASYDDNTTKDVTASATFSTPDMTTVGEQTVTVSYTEGEVTKTATYDINLSLRPGSEALPYTVAQARAAIDANAGVTVEGVYATGIVSEIVTAYSTQYKNISYNISVDGEPTGDQLQAFRGKNFKGANFTSDNDIKVGDKVVIYGNLKKYGQTYEFDSNNQLVSLERANFITDAANATWVAPAKVKVLSEGVTVYTVTYDDVVGCTRKHEVADKVIPANEAVLLTSSKGAATVKIAVTDDEAAAYADLENDLLGSKGDVQGDTNIFCLAVGDKGLGFYPVSDEIYVPAGKAYLLIPATQAAPSYIWFNGDTTAIDSLTTDTAAGNESGEIYSLTGQRVGKNYRGIVIMNGRKVLKK